MILFEPEIRTADGAVRVSARIEFASPVPEPSYELTFAFPEDHEGWVTDRSDGFLTAILLRAMECGEGIEVRGRLSPRLLLGLQEYQRAFNSWFPRRFRIVEIRYGELEPPDPRDTTGAVTCAFSGGVDSFYTLWSHLPANDPHPQSALSHALFVHGFDIPLQDEATFRAARAAYDGTMRGLGIRLLTARSNIVPLVPRSDWGVFHGTALVSVALVLGRLLGRFYVPSSHTYNHPFPWGSDPRIDHLLSTETLQVVHDGASATRMTKTALIGRWPETFGRLRVCAARFDGVNNCGRCEKCVRTMLALDMVGQLASHTTFPVPLTRKMIRGCRYMISSEFASPRAMISYARAIGRWDVVVDLTWAVVWSRQTVWRRRVRRALGTRLRKSVMLRRTSRPRPTRAPPGNRDTAAREW